MISVMERTTSTNGTTSPPHWEGPADPIAVRESRHAARRALLAAGMDDDVIDTVTVLVSELVTNAVQAVDLARMNLYPDRWYNPAAPAPVLTSRVVIDTEARTIRMEVFDPIAERQPVLNIADETDERGRGMALVSAMCPRWGCHEAEGGKCVWAELPLELAA